MPIVLAMIWPALASAGQPSLRQQGQHGVLADFRTLADMRPRRCAGWDRPLAPSAQWRLLSEQCAWQGRLRLHRLIASDPATPGCVSAPAQWWSWARRSFGAAPAASTAWYANWPSQAIAASAQDVQRLAVVTRARDGSWVVDEWNWKPSPRMATRRWQDSRWRQLLAEAARMEQPAPSAPEGVRQLRAAWEGSLGPRPGEIMQGQWRWPAAGHCLLSDTIGVSDGNLRLPFLTEDSRLEQRAAMQLQLARRYPGAVWIRPFGLADTDPGASGKGGARYKAVWREQSAMRGQLWIPTKGDGPVLRLRISTALPPSATGQEAVAKVLDQELESLSRAWGRLHE